MFFLLLFKEHTDKQEDKKFIDLIKELVKHYISKENSIIVATITCKDEIDNQCNCIACKRGR